MGKKGLDYHLHTEHLGCANKTMTIEGLLDRCEDWRMTSIGITDHLNSLDRIPDHEKIVEDLKNASTNLEVFLGVELNVVSNDPEPFMPYDEKEAARLGFTYSVGGPHGTYLGDEYDLQKLVKTQHDLMLWCLRNPVVDVLVHPWWFGKGEFKKKGWPWFNDLSVVPDEYHHELAAVACEMNKPIEVNAGAIFYKSAYSRRFQRQYVDYLKLLKEDGVLFTVCSDAHDINSLGISRIAEEVLDEIGVEEDKIWTPHAKGAVPSKGSRS